MSEADGNARDTLQGLFHSLTASQLALELRSLVKKPHQARLKLVGKEFAGRADVKNRNRPRVAAVPDHVEDRLGLATLRTGNEDVTGIAAIVKAPRIRDNVRRKERVARAGLAGRRRIDAVIRAPLVSRRLLRRFPEDRGQIVKPRPPL